MSKAKLYHSQYASCSVQPSLLQDQARKLSDKKINGVLPDLYTVNVANGGKPGVNMQRMQHGLEKKERG